MQNFYDKYSDKFWFFPVTILGSISICILLFITFLKVFPARDTIYHPDFNPKRQEVVQVQSANEINRYLDSGWTVKTITTLNNKTTVIFDTNHKKLKNQRIEK